MRPPARWAVRADDRGDGWQLAAPEPWDERRHMQAILDPGDAAVLAGFDVPLGVPVAWAHLAGVRSFRDLLGLIADDAWPHLLDPAPTPADIGPRRPFYPRAPGGSRRQHLVDALGLQSADDLFRACDRPVPDVMGAAAPVFWLVGPQQVGKAAITAWREVVVQAAARGHVRLWPFDGDLLDLFSPGRSAICECYPRAAYEWPLGFPRTGWSKRRQADRRARARDALAWIAASGLSVRLHPDARAALDDGFGPLPSGEDPFDATMGALQLIAVVEGLVPAGPAAHLPGTQLMVEGWILGRPAGSVSWAGARS
ncbi:MAG: DUF429 domain-containing protein [Actinobacteria bacterium]|nr:DUF429 domain-containing protein [Actinomycetota bacterium]